MALLKVTAELLPLHLRGESLEDVCEKIAQKNGVTEKDPDSTWVETIDPASMPYVVLDEKLYLVSDLDVTDASETYSVMFQEEDSKSIFLDAVIDDEEDFTLKEVFEVGFDNLTKGE